MSRDISPAQYEFWALNDAWNELWRQFLETRDTGPQMQVRFDEWHRQFQRFARAHVGEFLWVDRADVQDESSVRVAF